MPLFVEDPVGDDDRAGWQVVDEGTGHPGYRHRRRPGVGVKGAGGFGGPAQPRAGADHASAGNGSGEGVGLDTEGGEHEQLRVVHARPLPASWT